MIPEEAVLGRGPKFRWLRAAIALAGTHCAVAAADRVSISINPDGPAVPIPRDFIGFGYETAAAARPGFFSPKNTLLVQLYRTLGSQGLVRIGGNISDHAIFRPEGKPTVAPQTGTTVINRSLLIDLGGFLRATGWKLMWGLNLGTGTKEQAAEEAVAVSAAVGDRLQSFEIGNEVDRLPRLKGDFGTYHEAYVQYKAAIRAALPSAVFSGPDVTFRASSIWAADFADAESADMRLLTQHYYRASAQMPEATISTLLARDHRWDAQLRALRRIGLNKGLSYRINEVNSFSGGGKPGVSDTFASALWCLDYMFLLASDGCAGVNIETDVNQFSWVSHYSPIFRDESGQLSVRPCYYGMLAFAMAGRGRLLNVTMDARDIEVASYAAMDSRGGLWLTVINKDLHRDVTAEVAVPMGYSTAEAYRLAAPSAESRDAVTLAGSKVSADGKWIPGPPERIAVIAGVAGLPVPHASAVFLRLREPPESAFTAKRR